MTTYEAIFIWVALYIYLAAFFSFLWGFVFKKEKSISWGWYISLAGFIPHNISMLIRWYVTGHAPVMREYENATLAAWFIIVLYMILKRWHKKMMITGIAIMPVVLLMIGNGLFSGPYLEPLSPPFKSNWLVFHIFFAWIAYGAFFVAMSISIIYLLKDRTISSGKHSEFYDNFPSLGILYELILKIILLGFITLTVEMGAGAIWAYGLWGRYWGWDPVETWALITWLTYGIYLHLGLTLGWKGKKMAWLAFWAMIFVYITLGGIGFIGGIHQPLL